MNPEAIIECVPNFSEGTDATKVQQIVAAMQVEGVRLLDWSLDTAHNRSVVTIAGTPAGIVEAAVRAAGKAAELINLTTQNGVHPRIGAADVIPFIPVSGASLADCPPPAPTASSPKTFAAASSKAFATPPSATPPAAPTSAAPSSTPPQEPPQ